MELVVHVKNVHHGDSIVLETKKDGLIQALGIIDCSKDLFGLNPVLEHLETCHIKEIDFILLSHPHTDHYSGLIDLLKFCQQNEIVIKRFFHTCSYHSLYLEKLIDKVDKRDLFLGSVEAKYRSNLESTFRTIFEMTHEKVIHYSTGVSAGSNIVFGPLKINVLAPGIEEFGIFCDRMYNLSKGEGIEYTKNNPMANILSTVLELELNRESSIVFSSDCENHVLSSIGKAIDRRRMKLCQVSHHGSKHSYSNEFWSEVNGGTAFVSHGYRYNLPSPETVKALRKANWKVHLTNGNAPKDTFSKSSKLSSGFRRTKNSQKRERMGSGLTYRFS